MQQKESYDWRTGFYEKAQEEININYLASVKLIDAFLKQKNIQGKAIVNISSLLGVIPKCSAPTYCSQKQQIIHGIEKNRYEIRPGKSQKLSTLYRFLPNMMDKIMSGK